MNYFRSVSMSHRPLFPGNMNLERCFQQNKGLIIRRKIRETLLPVDYRAVACDVRHSEEREADV